MLVLKTNLDRASRFINKQSYRIGPLLIIAACAVVFVGTPYESIGSISAPGPGLWPLSVATVTALLAAVALIGHDDVEAIDRRQVFRVTLFISALFAFAVLYEAVGFIVPAFFMLLFLLRVIGNEKWWLSLITSALGATMSYLLFATMLGVPLDGLGN